MLNVFTVTSATDTAVLGDHVSIAMSACSSLIDCIIGGAAQISLSTSEGSLEPSHTMRIWALSSLSGVAAVLSSVVVAS